MAPAAPSTPLNQSPCAPEKSASSGTPIETVISRMVCFVILVGVALTYFVSDWFHLINLFVAANYFQSTFSWGICPPSIFMRKIGWAVQDPEPNPRPVERVYFLGRGKPNATMNKRTSTATATSTDSSS